MFLMSLLPKASDSWIMTHQKASWSDSTVLRTPIFGLFFTLKMPSAIQLSHWLAKQHGLAREKVKR